MIPAAAALAERTLEKGMEGTDVLAAQQRLQYYGFYDSTLDGKFGAVMRTAVVEFQRKNELVADGKIGPMTLAALNSSTALSKTSPDPVGTLQAGMSGENVKVLQRQLRETYYYVGTIDGIYGANAKDLANYMSGDNALTPEQVDGSMPTRTDALINIIVGGTGEYQGATGVLIGSTSGGGVYGTTDGMTLPQTLFKLMEGYIRIPKNAEGTSSHAVTQPFSEDRAELQVRATDYAMVDVELRLQTGSLEEENGGPGAGIGTLLPFNAGAITSDSGSGVRAAVKYPVENYFNENWLDAYGEPTFVAYYVNDGTVAGNLYGWQFSYGAITDTADPLTATGSQHALFTLIVDGTKDFAGVTGILTGHDVITDPQGWGIAEYDNDAPLCYLTLMDGWLKVPADSLVVTTGGYANDTIVD